MLGDVEVAWDGSARSRGALEWTLRRRATRSVLLVRVAPEADVGADVEAAWRIGLDGEVQAVRARRPDLGIAWRLARGDVGPVLESWAVPGKLLVLGTGGLRRARLPRRTDVLAHLVREARGPVALIPQREPPASGPVLAGVDGTAAGNAAAWTAAAEAVAQQTSVVLMHVRSGLEAADGEPGEAMARCGRELAQRFPHLLVRQRAVHGDVQRELLTAAETVSLLVIGRHAVPGAGASLEEDALAGTGAPLLLVRDGDADRPAPVPAGHARVAG